MLGVEDVKANQLEVNSHGINIFLTCCFLRLSLEGMI